MRQSFRAERRLKELYKELEKLESEYKTEPDYNKELVAKEIRSIQTIIVEIIRNLM